MRLPVSDRPWTGKPRRHLLERDPVPGKPVGALSGRFYLHPLHVGEMRLRL
ncbi:MAG: hypothetical protein K0S42_1759, partial [Microvirga sp.]|nr:hypothetical protein [Microvirga sp.]